MSFPNFVAVPNRCRSLPSFLPCFWASLTYMLAGALGTFLPFSADCKNESFPVFFEQRKKRFRAQHSGVKYAIFIRVFGFLTGWHTRSAAEPPRIPPEVPPTMVSFKRSTSPHRVLGPTRRCRGRLIQGFREGCSPFPAALCLMSFAIGHMTSLERRSPGKVTGSPPQPPHHR